MEHMAACPSCQRYFDDLVAIHDALDQEEAPVPEGFAEQLMARVGETEQEKPRKVIKVSHWRQWTAMAACCALALLGLWSFRNAQGNQKAAQDAVAPLSQSRPSSSSTQRRAASPPAERVP